jgi:hypothetical protein
VEIGPRIIATAFVFRADDDAPHIDGLWIEDAFRKRIGVQRRLYRALKWALSALGGGTVCGAGLGWMRRRSYEFV